MSKSRRRLAAALGVSTLTAMVVATPAAADPPSTATGPSTSTAPYVLPVADGVKITSLFTVDDTGSAGNGYEMVGIPDGLGVRREGHDVVVYMNHELSPGEGITRHHGQQGAFVSELRIDRDDNRVTSGQDFIDPGIQYWDYLTSSYSTTPGVAGSQADGDSFPAYDARLGRFCSGDLTARGQLYNRGTGRGYPGPLYFANEEVGDEGRVFAVTTDGEATQLPRLGLFSWENTLVAANRSDTTVVMGQEDNASGQIRVYTGTKQRQGTPVERAGLANGESFVADLIDEAVSTDAQFRTTVGKGKPARFDLSGIDWDQSGADQNAEAPTKGLTLNRIEDGAFDPRKPNDFYFVTTAGGNGSGGGLWRLRWHDIEKPSQGGTLTLLLDGSEGLVSPDNIAIDRRGNLLIQEDPGNNPHIARIMAYRIANGALAAVAQFDPALFTVGQPGFITEDEESSGIVDAQEAFGTPGAFLFDAQVHAAPVNNVAEYVQRGQLMRLQIDDWDAVYGIGRSKLSGRALLSATAYQPGPISGTQLPPTTVNGVTPPFPGQPIPGFSAVIPATPGDRSGTSLLAMPDNGFGAKTNSADFLLRAYFIEPDYRIGAHPRAGDGEVTIHGFLQFRDPDRHVPFPIVNDSAADRPLTGADFDIESLARDARGDLWIGDEFGPYLVHTDRTGRVLEAPIPLPDGTKSPQSPDLQPGEAPTLPASRGFEAMAVSEDGWALYPILEGAKINDPDQRRRIAYEFDVRAGRYTERTWAFRVETPELVLGDAAVLRGRRLVLIERDNFEGTDARVKRLVVTDLDTVNADGYLPRRTALDQRQQLPRQRRPHRRSSRRHGTDRHRGARSIGPPGHGLTAYPRGAAAQAAKANATAARTMSGARASAPAAGRGRWPRRSRESMASVAAPAASMTGRPAQETTRDTTPTAATTSAPQAVRSGAACSARDTTTPKTTAGPTIAKPISHGRSPRLSLPVIVHSPEP